VIKAAPRSAFVVVDLLLEFLVVALDAPVELGEPNHGDQRGV